MDFVGYKYWVSEYLLDIWVEDKKIEKWVVNICFVFSLVYCEVGWKKYSYFFRLLLLCYYCI